MKRITIDISAYLTRQINSPECEITFHDLGPVVIVTEYHISPTLCRYVDSWDHLNAYAHRCASEHVKTHKFINNQTA